MVQATLLS